MNKIIYLDTSSTAYPFIYVSDYIDKWFNPNSIYAINEVLEFNNCEEKVKKAIGAKSGKVIFGGNASWFFEKLYTNQANFWLCSPYEHDCVYKNGLQVNYNELKYINNEIYCHQFVNNITGEIFPVNEIGKQIKNKNGYFVCDATAGLGKAKLPDDIDKWCDCLVASSHKLGVDNKQIGFAWISDRFANWLLLDGTVANGYGFIDGTPDLACAKATTKAVINACDKVEDNKIHYNNLIWRLYSSLSINGIENKEILCAPKSSAINAVTLIGINADILCNYLASKHQVYISPAHSACEQNSDYRVLLNYGLSKEEAESTVRISFSPTTTFDDIDILADRIAKFKEEYVVD